MWDSHKGRPTKIFRTDCIIENWNEPWLSSMTIRHHHHHHHHLPHHQEINHPFLVDLTWSSKDKSFLYMLFPYVSGGELFSYLRRFSYFESVWERFWVWRNPSQRWPVQLHDHLLLLGRDCLCSWLSPLSVCGVQVLDVFMRDLRLCWMRARVGFIFWCKNRIKLCKANLLLPSCMCRLTPDSYPLNIAQSFFLFCSALQDSRKPEYAGLVTGTVPFVTVPWGKKGL